MPLSMPGDTLLPCLAVPLHGLQQAFASRMTS